MSKKSQANKKLKKAGAPSPTGSNARERARQQAQAEKRKKDRMTLIIAAVVVVALVVGGGVLFSWFQSTRGPSAGEGSSYQDSPQQVVMNQPIVFGEDGAPNTISVWADFHCPHCIDFEEEYGPLIDKAIETGQWKMEAWPMAFLTAGSANAANAFACATEEGFGKAYQKALFENSNLEWNSEQLVDLADQVNGSVPETFASCVQNLEQGQWAESINQTSRAMGVSGTPTVRVNGEPYDLAGMTKESLAETLGVEP
ncbi:MAG: thioredoxin domain-containing protein [Propionibacterium sp.]|nr:thioredoxin domain-containing protein [Propionibacterium sp.]